MSCTRRQSQEGVPRRPILYFYMQLCRSLDFFALWFPAQLLKWLYNAWPKMLQALPCTLLLLYLLYVAVLYAT